MNDERFTGTNDDELTLAEVRAIQGLARLSKRWPRTLKLVSMGGSLHAVHTDDNRFHSSSSLERGEAVLYTFSGIPNDGGDW